MEKGFLSDLSACEGEKCNRKPRLYFGGVASCIASIFTAPFDLLKVQLQTQENRQKGMFQLTRQVVKISGVLALYTGLSASMTRQMMYSVLRYGIYEDVKKYLYGKEDMPFEVKVTTSGSSAFIGCYVGAPADLVTVRMMDDAKFAKGQRRGYRNGIHGMYVVARDEGPRALYMGASVACTRAVILTIGQLALYDEIKAKVLENKLIEEGRRLHFFCSMSANMVATFLTQPLDVVKTRMMNDSKNKYKGVFRCALSVAREGPHAFYKGIVPSFLRVGPFTVITYVVMEQLRINFGIDPSPESRK